MKINDLIYFDHQATTPVDRWVLAEMEPFWRESFGNPHSSDHVFGWQSNKAVEKSRESIAELIGGDADEVVFTSGATESNNIALLGLARGPMAKEGRRRILVSATEHKCILTIARSLEEQDDFQIDLIPADRNGLVDLECLKAEMDENIFAVSVMAVNNEIGSVQDIGRIGQLAHAHGAFFHCDAAQAPCAVDMSKFAEYIDLLSLSGHKMYGPKGIGALFIRRDIQKFIKPLFLGGGQQSDLRSGTLPTPLCVGMGAAARTFMGNDAHHERQRLARLRDRFFSLLGASEFPVEMNGPDSSHRHPGNANICFPGHEAQDILTMLQPKLAASTGSACTSGIQEPSHVLKAINLSSEEADASIRFSLGRETTEEDVEKAASLIIDVLRRPY